MSAADSSRALLRALMNSAPRFELREIASRDWASATFVGAAHRLTLAMASGPESEAWLATLPEAELTLPGHVLADIVVEARARDADSLLVVLRALTLDVN